MNDILIDRTVRERHKAWIRERCKLWREVARLYYDDLEAGRLVRLFGQDLPNNRGIYAVYPHRRYLPARVRTFVDFIANWIKQNMPRV